MTGYHFPQVHGLMPGGTTLRDTTPLTSQNESSADDQRRQSQKF